MQKLQQTDCRLILIDRCKCQVWYTYFPYFPCKAHVLTTCAFCCLAINSMRPSLYVFSTCLRWTETPLQHEGFWLGFMLEEFFNLQWMPQLDTKQPEISDLSSSMGPLAFKVPQFCLRLMFICLVENWTLICLSWIRHSYYSFVLNPFFSCLSPLLSCSGILQSSFFLHKSATVLD